jgi:transcriptional regulator with XRE-family HTH domain
MFLMSNFGEWLYTEMLQRDWTQSKLAKYAGLNRAVVNKIINGASKPTPETINALAHALRIPPELVFEKAGLLPPNLDLSPIKRKFINFAKNLPDSDLEMILALLESRTKYYEKNPQAKPAK